MKYQLEFYIYTYLPKDSRDHALTTTARLITWSQNRDTGSNFEVMFETSTEMKKPQPNYADNLGRDVTSQNNDNIICWSKEVFDERQYHGPPSELAYDTNCGQGHSSEGAPTCRYSYSVSSTL